LISIKFSKENSSTIAKKISLYECLVMSVVSNFSKSSLFSQGKLNIMTDITLDKNYATICGYTHDDLKTVFKAH